MIRANLIKTIKSPEIFYWQDEVCKFLFGRVINKSQRSGLYFIKTKHCLLKFNVHLPAPPAPTTTASQLWSTTGYWREIASSFTLASPCPATVKLKLRSGGATAPFFRSPVIRGIPAIVPKHHINDQIMRELAFYTKISDSFRTLNLLSVNCHLYIAFCRLSKRYFVGLFLV